MPTEQDFPPPRGEFPTTTSSIPRESRNVRSLGKPLWRVRFENARGSLVYADARLVTVLRASSLRRWTDAARLTIGFGLK
jgi:hypothetical protein